jgi:hypothetical protein
MAEDGARKRAAAASGVTAGEEGAHRRALDGKVPWIPICGDLLARDPLLAVDEKASFFGSRNSPLLDAMNRARRCS